MPALFSDHMVVQANEPVDVWGWAEPKAAVKVAYLDNKGAEKAVASATADDHGAWRLKLPPTSPGMAGHLVVESDQGGKIEVHDVVSGEVWLGGGQSNMSYNVAAPNVEPKTLEEAKAEATSVRPSVRFFMTGGSGADEPKDDVSGRWEIADPETIGKCSAVAWYFGYDLHQSLSCPVGLIVSAVSGTRVEAWIPRKEFDETSVAKAIWKRHEDALVGYTKDATTKYRSEIAAWLTVNSTREMQLKNNASRPKEPYSPEDKNVPTRLYNGLIAGLEPYTIKGIIWFQADGNINHPEEYSELIQTLVQTWRDHWHAELPFYYVEMNNMHAPQQEPGIDRPLAQIREAQNGALKLHKTGVVASIDLGIAENPHFPVKKPVGDRLANLALSEVYHLPRGEVHSPEFSTYEVVGNTIRLRFKNANGLRAREGNCSGFALQKADGGWVWTDGKIEGSDLVLSTIPAPSPQAVRYAWADNPIISIENGAGLPLRPFQCDLKKK